MIIIRKVWIRISILWESFISIPSHIPIIITLILRINPRYNFIKDPSMHMNLINIKMNRYNIVIEMKNRMEVSMKMIWKELDIGITITQVVKLPNFTTTKTMANIIHSLIILFITQCIRNKMTMYQRWKKYIIKNIMDLKVQERKQKNINTNNY